MSFLKKLFRKNKIGDIKFVLLVASLPEEPSASHMSSFLFETLPELKTVDAKIGFLWVTDPIDSVDMYTEAEKAFGSIVSDESKYTYRTMGYQLASGHSKILVFYEKL